MCALALHERTWLTDFMNPELSTAVCFALDTLRWFRGCSEWPSGPLTAACGEDVSSRASAAARARARCQALPCLARCLNGAVWMHGCACADQDWAGTSLCARGRAGRLLVVDVVLPTLCADAISLVLPLGG